LPEFSKQAGGKVRRDAELAAEKQGALEDAPFSVYLRTRSPAKKNFKPSLTLKHRKG
jgi:hypothetical protein